MAREWVWHMRNRPIGNYATEILRNTMRHRTAEQAIGKVETMLREMDDKLGHGPDGSEIAVSVWLSATTSRPDGTKPTRRPAIQLSASTGRNGPSTRTTRWDMGHMYVFVRAGDRGGRYRKGREQLLGLYVVDFLPVGEGRPAQAGIAR